MRSKKLHTAWHRSRFACEIWGWHWKYHLYFGTHFQSWWNKAQWHWKLKRNFKNHKRVCFEFRAKVPDGFSSCCNGSPNFNINSITVNSYSYNKQMKACKRSESIRRSATTQTIAQMQEASSKLNRVHTELYWKKPFRITFELSRSSKHQDSN